MIAAIEAWRAGLFHRRHLMRNLGAGLVVGVVALPLAMAFAIASGARPEQGIYTGIVAGLLAALFGSSRVSISGPTGAFIVILAGITAKYGIDGLQIATLMAGLILLAMGLVKLGAIIRFIPTPVVTGFTSGIAVIIFVGQWKDFFGLTPAASGQHFHEKLIALVDAMPDLNLPTTLLALGALAIVVLLPRVVRRIPSPLVAMLAVTLAQAWWQFDDVATIGSAFGGIPAGLPEPHLPTVTFARMLELIGPAVTIAMLGAIESLLCAVVADGMAGTRHDPNQELVGQGIANLAAPVFGGFAATGAIARTATNIRTGGRTPIAGMIHAGVLLAIVLALAPAASHIPLATLSAIVVMVSINMGEWHAFAPRELLRYSLQYRTILLGTFFITVVFDLTLAVEIGMVLASLFFIYRMSDLTRIDRLPLEDLHGVDAATREDGTPRIVAYRLEGSLFFGAANKLENLLLKLEGLPEAVILDMDKVINIDTTGLDILQTLHRNLHKRGAHLVLCRLNAQPASIVVRSGFGERLGADNITASLAEALARARHLSGREPEIAYA